MIHAALDSSVAWYQVCDEIRSQITGLPQSNAVWILPSLEAALIEISSLLADRERETGGNRNAVVYPRAIDPALETMASTLSSAGLDMKSLSDSDFSDPGIWFPNLKAKCLLVAVFENDRFFGRVHAKNAVIDAVISAGNKVPLVRVSFESKNYRSSLPRSYEILVNVQASGAAVVVIGDRFRVLPRIAPFSMSRNSLRDFQQDLSSSVGVIDRTIIEEFEANLPPNCRVIHAVGAARMLDRSVWTVPSRDGSFVRDRVLDIVARDFANLKSTVSAGLSTLSGCFGADSDLMVSDERRQEWLRARGFPALEIRGTMILSSHGLQSLGPPAWLKVLAEATQ